MTKTYLTLLGLGLISLVGTAKADVLDRGTSVEVVVANTVHWDGSASTPVMFRVVSAGPLAAATLEGRFNPKPNAWVLTEFEAFVLPNGLQVPLGKVKGTDAYGTQSIEVLQSDRSQWAAYVGRSTIPAGTHFSMMLTANIQVPSFNRTALVMNR